MTRRPLAPYFVLTSIASMAMGGIFALLGELRAELSFSGSELGFMVSMGFFAGFASQVWLSRYSDRGHAKTMIVSGQVLMIAGLAMMAVVSDLWWFVAARVVLGVGVGVFLPAVRRVVIVSDLASIGANVGLLSAFDVGGFIVGPLLAGFLAHFFGLRAPFIVLALVLAASLPLAARLPEDRGATTQERRVVRALLERRAVRAILAASAQGLQGAILQLSAGLVALVAGTVYEHWGRAVVFVANGFVLVFGVMIALWIARPLDDENDEVIVGSQSRI